MVRSPSVIVPGDVIAFPQRGNEGTRWVLMNVFARTSVGVEADALEAITAASVGREVSGKFRLWKIQRFSNADGLMSDPSRFIRDSEKWGEGIDVDFAGLVQALRRHYILVEPGDSYREIFARKKNIFDKERLGNYHDQLGSHLILDAKENPSSWWIRQKFTPGLDRVREDSLYFSVQAQFLEKYFLARIPQESRVLDLGCGVGYYANLMGKSGASHVLGVDPSDEYIQTARSHAGPNVEFLKLPVGTKDSLREIPAGSIDFAFMSDALQFYFVPYGKDEADIAYLIAEIRRVLKPGAKFTFMEPHPSYYQAPWLGDADRPYTLKTEYRNRVQGIIPTLQEYTQAFLRNGFVLTWLEEVYGGEKPGDCDERALRFSSEFPLWMVCEYRKEER